MVTTIKLDPHNHKKYYDSWKNKGMKLKGISTHNHNLIIQFLEDMELGYNVSPQSPKGSRSTGRLRNLKAKLHSIFILLEHKYPKIKSEDITDRQILEFFQDLREGKLKSPRTQRTYTSVGIYVKTFKTYWNWLSRTHRKEGKAIENITIDLDGKDNKPKFNRITIEQLKILCDNSKLDYKTLMMFLFDSGIRAPTELMNVKVSDLEYNKEDNHYTLNIREETSKTFGRRIKLLLCSDVLKQYLKQNELSSNNYLFNKHHVVINKYLRELAYKHLGIGTPNIIRDKQDNEKIIWIKDGLTMYDFRHSSACYWLKRYKSESALKYRFGWKKSDMIYYYTELLGMTDTLQTEDLYVDVTKTELQREIDNIKKETLVKEERLEEENKELKDRLTQLEDTILSLKPLLDLHKKGRNTKTKS